MVLGMHVWQKEDPVREAREFVKNHQLTFPVVVDADGQAVKRYAIEGVPTNLVIGKNGVSLEGEIKQASQEAPESVDRQRIPRGYQDSTKGYFKNIGNQKTGENAPKK